MLNNSISIRHIMKKIILVDSHQMFREGIRLLIEDEEIGEVIAEAENGKDFLLLLNNYKPDLVIMDKEMPVMDGLEATKLAIEAQPYIKVLILTDMNESVTEQEIINSGAVGFVLKSAGKGELERGINKVISRNY